ncbi:MAG: hypothetical protein ACI8X5_000719 [Planctomycetota bacterium]|jgi:hypothetical protein
MDSKHIRSLLALALVLVASWFGGYYIPKMMRSGEQSPITPPPVLTGDPHVDDFRHLSWLLREKWSWLEMRENQGLSLDALEEEALALSKAELGERGFLRGLTRYISGISDGHGSAGLADVDLGEELKWPFTLIEVEEGVMVDGIGPTLFKSEALKRGDLILAVDGRTIDEVIHDAERFVFASTPGSRRRKAIYLLTANSAQESLIVQALRMGESEPITIEVPCILPSEPVPKYAWRNFKWKFEEIDSETAYLCIGDFVCEDSGFKAAGAGERNEMVAETFDVYAATFEKVCQKSNLVLDLRGNGGGTDLLGQALGLHLMEPGFRYFRLSSRRNGSWFKTGWQCPEVGRETPRFTGRLVCLIDEKSFSTTDNLASSLRDERSNTTFIGQPTGGGSGAPRSFTLPSTGAHVRFCTMRVFAPDDTYIEGNGVQPDLLVRPTRAQMLAGEDAVLEAAVRSLKN